MSGVAPHDRPMTQGELPDTSVSGEGHLHTVALNTHQSACHLFIYSKRFYASFLPDQRPQGGEY